jgi:hypothetical protein
MVGYLFVSIANGGGSLFSVNNLSSAPYFFLYMAGCALVGGLPILLIVLAVAWFLGRRRVRRRIAVPTVLIAFLGVGLALALLILGPFTPDFRLLPVLPIVTGYLGGGMVFLYITALRPRPAVGSGTTDVLDQPI